MLCLKGLCPKKTKISPFIWDEGRNKCQSPLPSSIKRSSPIQIPMNLRHQELLGVSKSPPSKARSDLKRYEDVTFIAPGGFKIISHPEHNSYTVERDDRENIIFPPI